MTYVSGTPATFARRLARTHLLHALSAGLVGLALFLFFLTASPLSLLHGGAHAVLSGLLLLGSALLALRARSDWEKHQKAAAGVRSEDRVASALRDVGLTALCHGLLLGAGGDVDHVALGPVLAAVETKTGRGRLSVKDGHLVLSRGQYQRTIPGDPLGQARRQAQKLGRLANTQASPVVCVVDMENAPFTSHGVVVSSLKDLPSTLAGLPRPLASDAARSLVTRLEEVSQREEAKKEAARSSRTA